MKTTHLIFAIFFALTIFSLSSCNKDKEISKPEIKSFELGNDNSNSAYPGSDLHIEADIVAEGKINRIEIKIHHEGEHGKKFASYILSEGEWEVDSTYVKFSGLKNTIFHEDLDIPADAETGDYHFHFAVIDMEGNKAEVERELEIKLTSPAK
jgi:hypothetical protein